jgi:GNAT superfamily N-acetyltransferase
MPSPPRLPDPPASYTRAPGHATEGPPETGGSRRRLAPAGTGWQSVGTQTIRPARPGEGPALHTLSLRSKAHGGYDAAFMARAAPARAIPDDWIARGAVLVAEAAGEVAGVGPVPESRRPAAGEIAHLFVAPRFIGRGIGTALRAALAARAAAAGMTSLAVAADPQARAFCERSGFRHIGFAPSDAVAGRSLPRLSRPVVPR